jgi:hypothetical protein
MTIDKADLAQIELCEHIPAPLFRSNIVPVSHPPPRHLCALMTTGCKAMVLRSNAILH